jgi:hypothetical protein
LGCEADRVSAGVRNNGDGTSFRKSAPAAIIAAGDGIIVIIYALYLFSNQIQQVI